MLSQIKISRTSFRSLETCPSRPCFIFLFVESLDVIYIIYNISFFSKFWTALEKQCNFLYLMLLFCASFDQAGISPLPGSRDKAFYSENTLTNTIYNDYRPTSNPIYVMPTVLKFSIIYVSFIVDVNGCSLQCYTVSIFNQR